MTTPSKQTARPQPKFRVGDWVKVLDADSILSTLDEEGALDGLSFMAEMLPFCGREFRVKKIGDKTCVNSQYIAALGNAFVLQTQQRCDGSAHGGCQMACSFFWRREWLEAKTGSDSASPDNAVSTFPEIQQRLVALGQKGNNCFRCQATELVNISTPLSPLKLSQYVTDFRSGIPAGKIASFLFGVFAKKAFRRSDNMPGPCEKRTPTVSLGLEVGAKVRVKSLEEIVATLDKNGCNRGLWFDPAEMKPFCGMEMVVSRVIHRLIDEKNGKLRELPQPCIVLAETECSGIFRRFCSRGMLHFWREIWLERR